MAEIDPNLESILPEVHAIFNEKATEKDLATIKRVKKIEADTRQIVKNRELEIKEVVMALQQRVEKEEHAADDDRELAASVDALKVLETQRDELESLIDELNSNKENAKVQIQTIRDEIKQVQSKKQHVEKEMQVQLPRNKGLLALYNNISNIRWDSDSKHWKGVVVPAANEPNRSIQSFEFDPMTMTEFELCNALWDMIE
eukprot:521540-Hanusia_phi.AAC.2